MVKFTENVVERTRRNVEYVRQHEKELPPRTITVQLTKEDDFLSQAAGPGSDLVWYADEAKERGGTGKGPSPLSTFLSAMGFCQFVHYAEHCIVENVKLDSLEMKIDGKVSIQRPRRFIEVAYDVKIFSSENDSLIRKIARAAADDCYVTNTLRNACKVTGTVTHNGSKIDDHL